MIKSGLVFLDYYNYPILIASFGKQIFDKKTFDLDTVCWNDKENKNILRLNFKLGSYFNYVNYYELISKELYFHLYTGKIKCSKIKDCSKKELLKLYRILTFREALKDIDILKDFKKRPVKLGINVFVLMKKPDKNYCTFIQKRGETQVEYPGFYHVAPAGTFQPLCNFDENIVKDQFNFSFTVLRELLEEIYNLEEADKKNNWSDPFKIFNLNDIGKLLQGGCDFEKGQIPLNGKNGDIYEIIPTGFLIDLVSLKPELTLILHITDTKIYEKSTNNIEGNWEGPVKEFDIEGREFKRFLNQNLNIDNFLPAGAVALAEGLNYYLKKIKPNIRVK